MGRDYCVEISFPAEKEKGGPSKSVLLSLGEENVASIRTITIILLPDIPFHALP
jgi:hypothetical protein